MKTDIQLHHVESSVTTLQRTQSHFITTTIEFFISVLEKIIGCLHVPVQLYP